MIEQFIKKNLNAKKIRKFTKPLSYFHNEPNIDDFLTHIKRNESCIEIKNLDNIDVPMKLVKLDIIKISVKTTKKTANLVCIPNTISYISNFVIIGENITNVSLFSNGEPLSKLSLSNSNIVSYKPFAENGLWTNRLIYGTTYLRIIGDSVTSVDATAYTLPFSVNELVNNEIIFYNTSMVNDHCLHNGLICDYNGNWRYVWKRRYNGRTWKDNDYLDVIKA